MSKNTIEINGKLYDATTGTLVNAHQAPATKKTTSSHHIQVMDDFNNQSSRKHTKTHTPAPAASKQAEKSHTLMRRAVRKPADAHPKTHNQPLKAITNNTAREKRATRVAKSSLISRFGLYNGSIKTKVAPLDVQPEPEASVLSEQLLQHEDAKVDKQAHNITHKAKSHQNFDHALHAAQSHKQTHPKKARASHKIARKLHVSPRVVQAGSVFAASVLIVGFIFYQNTPNLAMRVAATRAGIGAKLPEYKPSGFAVTGPIQYSSGQITVSYRSSTDDRNFSITQKATDLSNESLLNQQVANSNKLYQTFQDDGKTIYVFDDSNATWVNNGILYEIEGKSALNTDQLLRLASSL